MKKHSLLLIALIFTYGFASTLGVVQAQSKPSIPEFTVKLVDNSYDVPPTQTTDPYTGTKTIPGYHVDKKEIELTIKNQKHQSKILYNIRTKGYFEQEWKERFYPSIYPEQDSGQYTTITFFRNSAFPTSEYCWYFDIPDSGQIDFQIEAWVGAFLWKDDPAAAMTASGTSGYYVFDGVSSGWSKTQTITINNTPDQTPDNSEMIDKPKQPSFNWIELVTITTTAIVITITVTVLILRKTNNTKAFKQ